MSQDPSGIINGDDANLYRYCGNSPVTFVDTNGLDDTSVAGEPVWSFSSGITPSESSTFGQDGAGAWSWQALSDGYWQAYDTLYSSPVANALKTFRNDILDKPTVRV
jgi:hypothetical protein